MISRRVLDDVNLNVNKSRGKIECVCAQMVRGGISRRKVNMIKLYSVHINV